MLMKRQMWAWAPKLSVHPERSGTERPAESRAVEGVRPYEDESRLFTYPHLLIAVRARL